MVKSGTNDHVYTLQKTQKQHSSLTASTGAEANTEITTENEHTEAVSMTQTSTHKRTYTEQNKAGMDCV